RTERSIAMSIFRGRTMPARVVRALAAASAAGVVGAAACVACAAPAPATEPTQQDLLEQIQSLRAKIERLEAEQTQRQAPPQAPAQGQQNLPATQAAPAFAAEPSAADDVARDASLRSQLLQNSGNFT